MLLLKILHIPSTKCHHNGEIWSLKRQKVFKLSLTSSYFCYLVLPHPCHIWNSLLNFMGRFLNNRKNCIAGICSMCYRAWKSRTMSKEGDYWKTVESWNNKFRDLTLGSDGTSDRWPCQGHSVSKMHLVLIQRCFSDRGWQNQNHYGSSHLVRA